MNRNHPRGDKQTVVLTVDATSYSLSTIDLAVEIAASVQTRLYGLFIEDEDLLRVAELPCTREIGIFTALERPTDLEQMQRSLHSMAGQFRKNLEKAAQASQIAWSFDSVRGRTDDLGLKTELNVAYTIVSQPLSHRPESKRFSRTRRVLLIENQSPHLLHALEVVLHRFEHEKVNITVISNYDKSTNHTQNLLKKIDKKGGRIALHELKRNQLSNLLIQSETAFDCAIISRHEEAGNLREIIKNIQCPVILVS